MSSISFFCSTCSLKELAATTIPGTDTLDDAPREIGCEHMSVPTGSLQESRVVTMPSITSEVYKRNCWCSKGRMRTGNLRVEASIHAAQSVTQCTAHFTMMKYDTSAAKNELHRLQMQALGTKSEDMKTIWVPWSITWRASY